MAAPMVSGIAALVWNYFPELTAVQLKQILLESVTPRMGVKILKPQSPHLATPRISMEFGELCLSGGIINALNAVQLAEKTVRKK